jgi:FkbM family methyltransferase
MFGHVNEWINGPEYIYQPKKLVERLLGKRRVKGDVEVVELPWKLQLEIEGCEKIGRIVSHHGIFELPVVETIFRLVDPGDIVLDVGANIGYMTAVCLSALARRVISFEPHPVLFGWLTRNISRWNKEQGIPGRVDARQEAVSSENGDSILHVPNEHWWVTNEGSSTLETGENQDGFDQVRVPTTTLDRVIDEICEDVGVLKIDIEGHEAQAFKGTSEALSNKKIRDVIYEDFEGVKSDSSTLLADYGYSIFGLHSTVTGLVISDHLNAGKPRYGDHNFVATLDPTRFKKRLAPRGYICMNRRACARFRAANAAEAGDARS